MGYSSNYYILEGKTPVPISDFLEWGRWMADADRHVAKDYVGPIWVSTVFLGLDHSFLVGMPILFETMIFTDRMEMEELAIRRYATWEQAEQGHKVALRYAHLLWKKSQLTASQLEEGLE